MPVPASELPILDALSLLRARLQALKRDTEEFTKAQDVFQLYKETLVQVTRLAEVREANERSRHEEAQLAQHTSAAMARLRERSGTPSTDGGTTTPGGSSSNSNLNDAEKQNKEAQVHEQEMNRVDTTLADVFHLLSLFFLTIGKSRSAPATYCQLAIMMKLLDHMRESGVYTLNDLQPFKNRLTELRSMITAEVDLLHPEEDTFTSPHPPQANPLHISSMDEDPVSHAAMTKLLLRKHDKCRVRLEELINSLSVINVDLVPLHQKIIYLRRHLAAIGAKGLKVNKTELDQMAEELRKIESSRTSDGKFAITRKGPDGAEERVIPSQGQQILSGLLEETFEVLQEIQSRDEEVDPQLKPIYDRLTEMRTALEKLILTHRWTLRETDLYNFQVSLQEIDRLRVNGKFVDAEGNKPHGQRVLLFNLRRCYGLIYRLMSSSEPISEELMPVANKLATIRRCLNEVLKFGGPFSARDLYPYQLALAQIEAIRVDGKFPARDGSLPEGQAILNAHLSESYEMIEMLKEEMDYDA